jgi:hypothetical protein
MRIAYLKDDMEKSVQNIVLSQLVEKQAEVSEKIQEAYSQILTVLNTDTTSEQQSTDAFKLETETTPEAQNIFKKLGLKKNDVSLSENPHAKTEVLKNTGSRQDYDKLVFEGKKSHPESSDVELNALMDEVTKLEMPTPKPLSNTLDPRSFVAQRLEPQDREMKFEEIHDEEQESQNGEENENEEDTDPITEEEVKEVHQKMSRQRTLLMRS